ncbi:hypothetical protein BS17DRAFT_866794, partial [Gyrodon lividus]
MVCAQQSCSMAMPTQKEASPRSDILPGTFDLLFEVGENGLRAANIKEVIDVDSTHDRSKVIMPVIYTVLTLKMGEAQRDHLLMQGVVPDMASLLHAIEALLELPNHVVSAGLDKTLRLFHVTDIVLIKEAIEECSFDVELFNFPVKGSIDMGKSVKQVQACSRQSGLVEVNTRDNQVTFADISDFEPNRLPILIALNFEHQLAVHDGSTSWNVLLLDKLVNTKLLQRVKLLLECTMPLISILRCHDGFVRGRLILQNVWNDTIRDGREEILKSLLRRERRKRGEDAHQCWVHP